MTTTLGIKNAASIRLGRIVYDKWNSFRIYALDAEGSSILEVTIADNQFSDDHKPIPIIWEATKFPDPKYNQLVHPKELFNIKETNRPENPQLTAIRELLMSYDEENETPNEMLHAIHEVIFGPTAGATVGLTTTEEPTA